MNIVKIILKVFIIIIITIVTGFGLFLAWSTLAEYRPDAEEKLAVKGEGLASSGIGDTITLLTWNIGYAGLGQKMDFFYEGGKQVRPSLNDYRHYMKGVLESLTNLGRPDFVLIQEADRKSRRSYYRDEVELIDSLFTGYAGSFATNYDVGFVPVPLTAPMGPVLAGICTLSRYKSHDTKRIAFASSYAWPKRLFMLDRCFLITRFNLSDGKELVLINTHNSAFNDAADMRKQELALLRKTMLEEFENGNFVIVGGDWNQNPLPFDPSAITDGNMIHRISPPIPADFIPGDWKWAFDPARATNRDVNEPYHKGHTGTTIIDFFVLSPNMDVVHVNAISANFEFSDHQAVVLKVSFRK